MADLGGFNAANVPEQSFEPLPDGDYVVRIVESERKMVKPPKTGAYIALKLEVIEGDCAGRTLFCNINLWNSNPQAVEIAQQTMASICRAVGNLAPRDTQELHNQPLLARVKAKRRDDNDEWSNEVKRFMPLAGMTIETPATPATMPPPAARLANQQGQVKAPWMKS